jgi:hypothetical protein
LLSAFSAESKKNKTSPLRAQRLCGENEYQNCPLLGGSSSHPFQGWYLTAQNADYQDICKIDSVSQ